MSILTRIKHFFLYFIVFMMIGGTMNGIWAVMTGTYAMPGVLGFVAIFLTLVFRDWYHKRIDQQDTPQGDTEPI